MEFPLEAYAQLELELSDIRKVLPWEGQSPRELARAAIAFRFRPEGMGPPTCSALPESPVHTQRSSEQGDLFLSHGGFHG